MAALTFVCSAPGKLILAGEHAVVHHTRALATVIDKRTFCQFDFVPATAEHKDEDLKIELLVRTKQMHESFVWTFAQLKPMADQLHIPSSMPDLIAGLDALKTQINTLPSCSASPPQVFLLYYFLLLRGGSSPLSRGSLSITIESQLPMSAGLGSSAAYTTSLCSGFIHLALTLSRRAGQCAHSGDKGFMYGELCSCSREHSSYTLPSGPCKDDVPTFQPCAHLKKAMNIWAYEGERIIHGNPSGVDNTCAIYGGIIVYRKGSEIQFLPRVPRLGILVVNTCTPRDTKRLVAGVGALKTKYPAVLKSVLEAVDNVVEEWIGLIRSDDDIEEAADANASFLTHAHAASSSAASATASPSKLSVSALESRAGDLLCLNQGLLDAMGVGHEVIHRVLALGRAHGFRAGKLTGAGGGGCVIILQPSETAATEDAAAAASAAAASSSTAAAAAPAAASAPSAAVAAAATAAPSLSKFTAALESTLHCEYLETVVGQAGVWIRNDCTLRQLPELAATAAAGEIQAA